MTSIREFVVRYRSIAEPGPCRDTYYWWHALDTILMEMCAVRPDHVNVSQVYAKVSIINRVYRANLHMGTDSPEWKVAEAFVENNADEVIAPLRRMRAFDNQTLATVSQCHGDLLNIAHRATNKHPISFCSKYLAFHFPSVVPIYDSLSRTNAQTLTQGQKTTGDGEYTDHCQRVLLLLKALGDEGIASPQLKLIDCILYGSG
jgi:hypothetical protein